MLRDHGASQMTSGFTSRALVSLGRAIAPLALAAALLAQPVLPAIAAENPLPGLKGPWSGSGEARIEGGKTEMMRCKGYYTSAGDTGLGLAIRCANAASAKIDLRANLTFDNGIVSGSWEERNYNAAGNVSGKATANRMSLVISGGGLSGSMTVSINGANHSVSISTQGTALKGVNISFSRG